MHFGCECYGCLTPKVIKYGKFLMDMKESNTFKIWTLVNVYGIDALS